MVVVRKNLSVEKGERLLFDDVRYYFYITNEWVPEREEIVFKANDRCNQENLLAQLGSGARALRAPVDNLISNWACNYILPPDTDHWGDVYNTPPSGSQQPDPSLIMSYNAFRTCCNFAPA